MNPCVKTPTKRAEGREINTDSRYAQATSGISNHKNETRKIKGDRESAKAGNEEKKKPIRHVLKAKAAPCC